jgi:hypothetical protein
LIKTTQSLGWFYWLSGSLLVIFIASVLQFEPPRDLVIPVVNWRLPPSCWTQRVLGFDCPGCGLTRSFVLAAHLQWADAWRMHAIGTCLFALLCIQIPYRLYQGLRHIPKI